MAGSLNKVMLIGNLGADPEIRSFQNGGKVANLRIATSETWKDRNTGERQERTEWHTVAIFSEGLVGVVERFLRKGSKVYIEGQLQTRKWQDQSGNDRYSTEVVLRGLNGTLTMLRRRPGRCRRRRQSRRRRVVGPGWRLGRWRPERRLEPGRRRCGWRRCRRRHGRNRRRLELRRPRRRYSVLIDLRPGRANCLSQS